jgi:hypothetical protein
MIFLLTPEDIGAIQKAYRSPGIKPPNLNPDDLIESITGIPNLTHAWNEYALRAEVVEKVIRS